MCYTLSLWTPTNYSYPKCSDWVNSSYFLKGSRKKSSSASCPTTKLSHRNFFIVIFWSFKKSSCSLDIRPLTPPPLMVGPLKEKLFLRLPLVISYENMLLFLTHSVIYTVYRTNLHISERLNNTFGSHNSEQN